MEFPLARLRYQPLEGFELTDVNGDKFISRTKGSILNVGAVHLNPMQAGECPYKVTINYGSLQDMADEDFEINGTKDPQLLSIARAYFNGAPRPFVSDWREIELPLK
jgi:hypothetical protein